jgi:hypothetical protein
MQHEQGKQVSWHNIKKYLQQTLSRAAHSALPLHQDLSRRGAHATPPGRRLLECILDPIPTKEMSDGVTVQSAHPKTLSCSSVVATDSKRPNVPIIFRNIMEEVVECVPYTLPLHDKIAAWHDDQRRMGQAWPLDISKLKTILIPRQAYSRNWI